MGHAPQLRDLGTTRLDSWKEIATFLRRDARTVRRWERERHLPVHRVPGGERSGVFAYVSELESWLNASGPAPDATAADVPTAKAKVVVSSRPADRSEAAIVGSATTLALVLEPSPGANPGPLASTGLHPDPAAAAEIPSLHVLNTSEASLRAAAPYHRKERRSTDPAAASSAAAPIETIIQIPSRSLRSGIIAALLLIGFAAGASIGVMRYRSLHAASAAHQPTPQAQDLYLQGRYYWNLRTESGLNTAVDLFTQAIVNDPQYAPAYAGLADSYLLLRQYGHMPNTEAFSRALAAARQAIALDDSCPDAHRSLAFILRFWNWDMPKAEKEYQRAIALKPNDSQSHHWYATALLSSGRYGDALTQIDIARSLEPQSVSVLADRGLILASSNPQAGVAALKQVEAIRPDFASTHTYLSGVYLGMGAYENFLLESRLGAQANSDTAALAVLDQAQEVFSAKGATPMLRVLAAGLAPMADRGSMPAYTVARYFGLAGDSDQAMRYLKLSFDHRESSFLGVDRDPAFAPLRSLGEYRALLSRRNGPFSS
jgi:tetratricopeptide (TPR) repeat protein